MIQYTQGLPNSFHQLLRARNTVYSSGKRPPVQFSCSVLRQHSKMRETWIITKNVYSAVSFHIAFPCSYCRHCVRSLLHLTQIKDNKWYYILRYGSIKVSWLPCEILRFRWTSFSYLKTKRTSRQGRHRQSDK